MAKEGGIDDILISYNLIGDEKMARLAALRFRLGLLSRQLPLAGWRNSTRSWRLIITPDWPSGRRPIV